MTSNQVVREDGALLREGAEMLPFARLSQGFALGEALAVSLVAVATADLYWAYALEWHPDRSVTSLIGAALGLGVAGMSLARGSYDRAIEPGPGFLWSGLVTVLRVFAALLAVLFVTRFDESYSRGTFVSQFATSALAILSLRGGFQRLVRARLAQGRVERQRLMIVGDVSPDPRLQGRLSARGCHVVARLPLAGAERADEAATLRTIVETCRTARVEQVLVHTSAELGDLVDRLLHDLSETPVTVEVLPHPESPLWRAKGDGLAGLPAAVVRNRPLSRLQLALKRGFDFTAALAALIFLAPLFIGIALAIRFDSKGPVFFRQSRHGYGNQPIRVFKFRSMRVMEDGAAFRQATRNDPRITRVGAILRRTNLDELPQILNVLFGEMSIVGPRPHPIALNETFAKEIKLFHRRHNIRPGITGWAQINGHRGETDTLKKMSDRIEHDLWYVDHWSFLLDLKIILMTAFSPQAYRNAG
ncbi:exopolysaccharide biosynthesis polyprenyl glycosylphosphotransferase [Aureimonas sp. AU40]|uniref:exopolysaccharide biosynthesis polyprenyl glycosylphosphotransferase n=1 Tax=Aureimonas sp. AU40 TaxID=1637747 RepID=UPI00078230A6|nr:exopolysaccharide biosynthesis polyprenyl glycosylphosphotransferase [Aureimonas sp. AU40]